MLGRQSLDSAYDLLSRQLGLATVFLIRDLPDAIEAVAGADDDTAASAFCDVVQPAIERFADIAKQQLHSGLLDELSKVLANCSELGSLPVRGHRNAFCAAESFFSLFWLDVTLIDGPPELPAQLVIAKSMLERFGGRVPDNAPPGLTITLPDEFEGHWCEPGLISSRLHEQYGRLANECDVEPTDAVALAMNRLRQVIANTGRRKFSLSVAREHMKCSRTIASQAMRRLAELGEVEYRTRNSTKNR